MRALMIDTEGASARLDDIDPNTVLKGPVDLDVLYSSLNYKDGLAVTGRGIARTWPLIPGIDIIGTVRSSDSPDWQPGDTVILNGAGTGETTHGGFAERARVAADFLVRLPESLSPHQAAAIGTAGFEAAIAVLKIIDTGLEPGDGEVLVTGAAGGVGSIAVALLAHRGYRVVASTGRGAEEGPYLERLGAARIIDRHDLSDEAGAPFQKQRWTAAVDVAGSTTLANVLAQTRYGGTVVACGMAQGTELTTTVFPFILRDVTLTGADTVSSPIDRRNRAWQLLADDLDRTLLDEMTTTIELEAVMQQAQDILAGRVRGRTAVSLAR
jgi:acrylyl-CoA reductase (NADPH)